MFSKKLIKLFTLGSITLIGTIGIIVVLFFLYLFTARNQPTTSNQKVEPRRLDEIFPIPGVTSQDIISLFEQQNLHCGEYNLFNSDFYMLTCEKNTSNTRSFISLFSIDMQSVYLIDANYTQYENPDDEQAIIYFGQIARLPFEGRAAEEAFAWVAKTMPMLSGQPDEIKSTTIDGIKFKLYGLPQDRSLEIGEIP